VALILKRSGRKNRNAYRKERSAHARTAGSAAWGGGTARHSGKTRVKRWKIQLNSLKTVAAFLSLTLITMTTLAGVCALSLWLYETAITSEFFATRHVDVTGNVRLSREMVLQYGGISEGVNSLSMSIAEIERRLLQTPWVEEVSVKRLLPDRFVIRVKERMPSFWVQRDSILYYANERGEIIAPVESENFLSLPTLSIEKGAEDALPYLSRLMQDLHRGVLPVEVGAIASVSLSLGRGVEIYLEDRELRLAIATDDWSGNLARMSVALGDLARRYELKNVREMRAVSGNVWVILNRPA